ncbi:MAG: hypothetical protein WAK95_21200 [Desulfobacterales bacterium]
MTTPVDRFKAARTRIYCFADSLDLCGTLLEAGARLIQLRAKTGGWPGPCRNACAGIRTRC